MPRLLTLAGLFAGVLLVGAAQAAMVDLTDNGWSDATRAYGDHHVTLSTGGTGRLSFSGYDGGSDRAACGKLNCSGDGVGINDDEIGHGAERLKATFSSAVTLNSVQFLDLFGAGHPGDPVAEGAAMLIEFAGGSNASRTVFGTDLSDAGYLDYAIGLSNIIGISFFTDAELPTNSDFALAGLDLDWGNGNNPPGVNDPSLNNSLTQTSLLQQPSAQSVPAPGVLWLMLIGLALIGLTGGRARRLPGSGRW